VELDHTGGLDTNVDAENNSTAPAPGGHSTEAVDGSVDAGNSSHKSPPTRSVDDNSTFG